MPAYDFRYNDCGELFTVRCSISEKENVTCPKCGGKNLTQRLTGFMIMGKSSSNGEGAMASGSSCSGKSCSGCSGC